MSIWIFGYGSLIWRPDFPYLEGCRARLHGWQRRFWQGSHDHRGLPNRPGRVVTLVETEHGYCDGMAYLVDESTAHATFEALDHREKNGYERHDVTVELAPASVAAASAAVEAASAAVEAASAAVEAASVAVGAVSRPRIGAHDSAPTARFTPAIVYIAPTRNHAYLGPAPLREMARQIAASAGPSGANRDYLLELAQALRSIGAEDAHVFELEAAVLGGAS